ncbi:Uncharacterized protein PBTT_08748 [Plasmodiophora brassicae]
MARLVLLFPLLVALLAAAAVADGEHAEEMLNRKDSDAVRGANHVDMHDFEQGAHRGANSIDQIGGDKSTVQTTAQLTAAMTASDAHADSYSQLLDDQHEVEAETEHDHEGGRDSQLGVHHGVNSDVDVNGDAHLRHDMVAPHRLHQNDWDGIEYEQMHGPHGWGHEHAGHYHNDLLGEEDAGAMLMHGGDEFNHDGPHDQWYGHGHGHDEYGQHGWDGEHMHPMADDGFVYDHRHGDPYMHHHGHGGDFHGMHGHGGEFEGDMMPWIAGGH